MSNRIEKRRDELLGKEFETNNCGKCFIIDYKGRNNVLVKFVEYPCEVKCCLGDLKKGNVKNPLKPSVFSKGYLGIGKYSPSDKDYYVVWKSLLQRVLDVKYQESRPTYKGATIVDEWLNFQNFASWCDEQEFFNVKDDKDQQYQLDKDILARENKVYSPNTCCFVPSQINSALISCKARRGDNPVGVSYNRVKRKFVAHITSGDGKRKHLGCFEDATIAFKAYKRAKETYIKSLAEKWKGKIDDKVYQSLLQWKIEITD